jgi:hypothetical protein
MGLVAAFGFGQGQQDLALFTLTVLGEIAVDGGFCAFVRQVLAPPADVGRCGDGLVGFRSRGLAGIEVLRHGGSCAGWGMVRPHCTVQPTA